MDINDIKPGDILIVNSNFTNSSEIDLNIDDVIYVLSVRDGVIRGEKEDNDYEFSVSITEEELKKYCKAMDED